MDWCIVLVEIPLTRFEVLASSLGISSWTPLKPQHTNPNPNPLANQLWCIDFLTPPTPLIIPHRLPAFLESPMPLKNWCSIHSRCSRSSLKHSVRFCYIFSKFKHNFIAYCSSKVSWYPDCIFEIHQLWQSGFSRVYSNSCCSCWFEPEIIKIGKSSHNMYSNKILNFQESTTILNAFTKKFWELIECTTYIYIYIPLRRRSLEYTDCILCISPPLRNDSPGHNIKLCRIASSRVLVSIQYTSIVISSIFTLIWTSRIC